MTKRSLPPTQRLQQELDEDVQEAEEAEEAEEAVPLTVPDQVIHQLVLQWATKRVASVTARAGTGHVLIAATISTLSGCRVSPPVLGKTRRLLHGTRLHTRVSWRWL